MAKKLTAMVALAGVAGLVAWRALTGDARAAPRAPARGAPVAVEVSPVRKEAVRDTRSFTGTLEARSRFVVAPKAAGRLRKLAVDIGDTVRRGALVALVEDDEYALAVEQASAELRVAEANAEESRSALEAARRELDRVRALQAKRIASEADLDAATAQYESREAKHRLALAQVEQKRAALRAAEVRLSYTRVEATWEDGGDARVVGERFADAGALVAAGTPLVSFIDIESLRGVVHVVERDYSRLRPGQPAEVSVDAFPGRVFQGRVSRIAPLVKEGTRQARVELDVPNPERLLKPGMFARVRIALESHEGATVVPVAAVARRSGREGVFLVEPDPGAHAPASRARFVPVRVGIVQGENAEILEPELAGEVVTLGHHLLEDGSRVIVASGPSDSPQDRRDTRGDPGEPTGRRP